MSLKHWRILNQKHNQSIVIHIAGGMVKLPATHWVAHLGPVGEGLGIDFLAGFTVSVIS